MLTLKKMNRRAAAVCSYQFICNTSGLTFIIIHLRNYRCFYNVLIYGPSNLLRNCDCINTKNVLIWHLRCRIFGQEIHPRTWQVHLARDPTNLLD